MERTKRQRQNSESESNKRNKVSSNVSSRFEDLPNETIYEICDFLDIYHIYTVFYNLNQRFRTLLTNGSLPIKINLSSISRAAFEHYYQHIMTMTKHRISSLRLSNLFTVDLLFPSIHTFSEFIRLETLSIHNLQSKYVGKLLKYLASLSSLCSLTIILIDGVDDRNQLYRRLFRLRALKYCKLSLTKPYVSNSYLSLTTVDERSPIEHLVLNHGCELHELISLLSCVPQVRRLSLENLYGILSDQKDLHSMAFNDLIEISIKKTNITFDELELLITNHFPRIQIVHFSRNFDEEYVDADRWQRLIQTHMSQLRVFDIYIIVSPYHEQTFGPLLSRFHSSFWLERQWFFTSQIRSTSFGNRLNLFSTTPYRRKLYTIGDDQLDEYVLDKQQIDLTSVHRLRIENDQASIICRHRFPNATELILCYGTIGKNPWSLSTSLNRILPLQQLTKLVVDIYNYEPKILLELLCATSNLHTLHVNSVYFYQTDLLTLQQDSCFQLASKTNHITNLTILTRCTSKTMKFFVDLCPQLQHLTLDICMEDFQIAVQFLLSKENDNHRHLFSLLLQCVSQQQLNMLKECIQAEKKQTEYYTKKVSDVLPTDVYVWW